ncbi:MAG: Lrp/AsnC ligand binding domain-containing protein [Candidatus Thorarchaeota archaeon]|nr:Lrp/AsnC ligand binding domain-containing protein [Candidatus Thorarchaeota archaeon]
MPLVFVGIKTQPDQSETVMSTLVKDSLVQEIYKVYAGQYDIVMIIDVPDLEAYHAFVQDVLAVHTGIADFESFIAV